MDAISGTGRLDAVVGASGCAGQPVALAEGSNPPAPQRVRQSLWTILMQIGTPAQPPKLRGKSPGWLKGRCRRRKERHKVVKKGFATAQSV